MNNMKNVSTNRHYLRWIVLISVTSLVIGYMAIQAFPGSSRYFLTVSEFVDREELQNGEIVRVSGVLVSDSFERPSGTIQAYFQLIDKPNEDQLTINSSLMNASYSGVLPDLFFNPHSEIILEGSYSSARVFVADSVLVKCPSKYQELESEGKEYPESDSL
jgi:cytochrome c-type biogenesis protein CcmE